MQFHRAIERIRGMEFSPAAWEQLLIVLSRTTDLHTKDAKHHYESTHRETATDEHATVILDQHRLGVGEEDWAPESALNDRSQKSWAEYVKTGNTRNAHHQLQEGYLWGAGRKATATGPSVMADPSYVPVTDDDNGSAFNVFMQQYHPFVDEDRVIYHCMKDGTPWTYGGGTGALRPATTTANWVNGAPPTVACTDDETGEAITVDLPRTMPGDPNVRSGAPLYYMVASDGRKVAMTAYMDDAIGTLKAFNADGDPYDGWRHHEASGGRFVPNYLAGDEDHPTTGASGGTKRHTHDPHSLSMSTIDVVTDFDDETCTVTTCQLCFVGSSIC